MGGKPGRTENLTIKVQVPNSTRPSEKEYQCLYNYSIKEKNEDIPNFLFFYDAGINRDTKNQTAALTTEKL